MKYHHQAAKVGFIGFERLTYVYPQAAKLGFIGLGNMGGHMARNLLKKGYPLVVFDVSKDNVKAVKEAGKSKFHIKQKRLCVL